MRRTALFQITLSIIALLTLYILIPLVFGFHFKCIPLKALAIFYPLNILLVYFLVSSHLKNKRRIDFEALDMEEQINLLKSQKIKEEKSRVSLEEKIRRYNRLKGIIESINSELELNSLAEHLVSITFLLIAKGRGNSLLYLVDAQTHRLSLIKVKKEDEGLVIKAKQGDIFDHWILRHSAPLLIEDIKKDFRFDLEKIKEEARTILSLVGSPFISDHRLLGVLRLDSSYLNAYTQDDLRFLVTICELGAVALENTELFQKTHELAIHDGLTSLYTKGYFSERLKDEFRAVVRQNGNLSLLMIDIDYFKSYNDRLGHPAGDIVLTTLSRTMADFLKSYSPIISRFGGEEFCVLLPGMLKKDAYSLAQKVRAKIEDTKMVLRRQETGVTVSIGVAAFPEDVKDEEDLLLKADKALYEAKQGGRNRVCCI